MARDVQSRAFFVPAAGGQTVSIQAINRALAIIPPLAWAVFSVCSILGVLILFPGQRLAALETRMDNQERIGRATAVWLCMNSSPDQQDMLDLPCYELLRNRAVRNPR